MDIGRWCHDFQLLFVSFFLKVISKRVNYLGEKFFTVKKVDY